MASDSEEQGGKSFASESRNKPAGVITRTGQRLRALLFGYDVFISYAHGEDSTPFARLLEDDLQERGVVVFRDENEIPPGGELSILIRWALRRTRVLVVVISRGGTRSEWVQREVGIFSQRKKKLIGLDIDGTRAAGELGPLRQFFEDLLMREVRIAGPDAADVDWVVSALKGQRVNRYAQATLAVVAGVLSILLVTLAIAAVRLEETNRNLESESATNHIAAEILRISDTLESGAQIGVAERAVSVFEYSKARTQQVPWNVWNALRSTVQAARQTSLIETERQIMEVGWTASGDVVGVERDNEVVRWNPLTGSFHITPPLSESSRLSGCRRAIVSQNGDSVVVEDLLGGELFSRRVPTEHDPIDFALSLASREIVWLCEGPSFRTISSSGAETVLFPDCGSEIRVSRESSLYRFADGSLLIVDEASGTVFRVGADGAVCEAIAVPSPPYRVNSDCVVFLDPDMPRVTIVPSGVDDPLVVSLSLPPLPPLTSIESIDVSLERRLIAVTIDSAENEGVMFFGFNGAEVLPRLRSHNTVPEIALSRDGAHIVTAGWIDMRLVLSDLRVPNTRVINLPIAPSDWVNACAAQTRSTLVALGTNDGQLLFVDTSTGNSSATPILDAGKRISDLAFLEDRVVWVADGKLCFTSLAPPHRIQRVELGDFGADYLASSTDQQLLVAVNDTGARLLRSSIDGFELVASLGERDLEESGIYGVWSAAIHPVRPLVYIGGRGDEYENWGVIGVWGLEGGVLTRANSWKCTEMVDVENIIPNRSDTSVVVAGPFRNVRRYGPEGEPLFISTSGPGGGGISAAQLSNGVIVSVGTESDAVVFSPTGRRLRPNLSCEIPDQNSWTGLVVTDAHDNIVLPRDDRALVIYSGLAEEYARTLRARISSLEQSAAGEATQPD